MKSHIPAMSILPFATATVVAAFALAGCAGPGQSDSADAAVAQSPMQAPAQSEQATAAEFDLDAYCAAVQPLIVPVPREYVGSAQHVADFDAVIAVAPANLVEDITRLRDHFEFDVHVSDPESQNFANFSPEMQEIGLAVDSAFREMCSDD